MDAPHFSFLNLFPILVIAAAKGIDEVFTVIGIGKFGLELEGSGVSAWFYGNFGLMGHLFIWCLFVGVFSAAYLLSVRLLPSRRFRVVFAWSLFLATLTVMVWTIVNNQAIYY